METNDEPLDNIIQLTLTQGEAVLLSSVTTLGLKCFNDDKSGEELTKILLALLIETCPKDTITLADKMVNLVKVTKGNLEDEIMTKLKERHSEIA